MTVHPQANLKSRWASLVSADKVLPDYPRPQMVRPDWVNLNGSWDLDFLDAGGHVASTSKILVPFPVESQLSGVHKAVPEGQSLRYRRTFARPAGAKVLLHFGACDWKTSVWVNGTPVGRHEGGYDPFSFDITSALKDSGDQQLVVEVSDPTDRGPQPRGKQVDKPNGIWYTSSSGIWQTVWLEPVPESYVESLKIENWPRGGQVNITPTIQGSAEGVTAQVQVLDGTSIVATSRGPVGKTLVAKVANAKRWSPDNPFLYNLRITLRDAHGSPLDTVTSYFGFREIAMMKNSKGQPMASLNGKNIFLFGPLDQGFWPDGLYTAPTDEALVFDIQAAKDIGFNMIRKHVKVEPARWYYWCDKLGMLVMQDMPSGDGFIAPEDPDITRTPESRNIYYSELHAMVEHLRNHPSIIAWIPFNEGWGQFETAEVTQLLRRLDPTRLIDSTTGWSDRGVGDFHDIHVYPGPGAPKPETARGSLLGEFGGLGLVVPEHTWHKEGWGYQTYTDKEQLTEAFEKLMTDLWILKSEAGLSGAVYTQTTDVETELNGLLTYDREIFKMDKARARKAIERVYGPPPQIMTVLPTSEHGARTWRISTHEVPDGWNKPEFSDAEWAKSEGGFGTEGTPGAVIGTHWDSSDIWMRQAFNLAADLPTDDLYLRIHHDDDVEVYLDGELVWQAKGWTTAYTLIHWPRSVAKLEKGNHVLAVHCHQNQGGQFIDVGLVTLRG